MSDALHIPLTIKTDRYGDEYLVGSYDLPVLLDLSKVSFFVFYPEEGSTKATLMIRSKDCKDNRPKDSRPRMGSPEYGEEASNRPESP